MDIEAQMQLLDKLRSRLKRGDYLLIQDETGFSISYISMVLNGRRENQTVLDSAIRIAENRQIEFDINQQRIAAL